MLDYIVCHIVVQYWCFVQYILESAALLIQLLIQCGDLNVAF